MPSIISQTDYTLSEFVEILSALHPRLLPTLTDVGRRLPDTTRLKAITYHYLSTDHLLQPVTLSALMMIPYVGGTFCAPRLVIENRATQAADKSVPTHQWNIGTAHVLTNSVLISPDLISFGASVDRPVCYCHAAMAARHTVDAAVAAQQLLMGELGLTTKPLPVYNTGHSQGGFDALSVHRYMETQATDEERRMVPLVRSYCASGPYVPDVLTRIVAAQEKYLYGAYMVLNAMSHLCYHAECFDPQLTIDDFLTPAARQLGLAEMIAAKQHSNVELVKTAAGALGTRTSALFQPDVYQPDGRIYAMMMRASVADRLIDGWTPHLPILFYHATYDECVPVACMHAVQEAWGDCPNVTFIEDDAQPDPMVHKYSGGAYHRMILSNGFQ